MIQIELKTFEIFAYFFQFIIKYNNETISNSSFSYLGKKKRSCGQKGKKISSDDIYWYSIRL